VKFYILNKQGQTTKISLSPLKTSGRTHQIRLRVQVCCHSKSIIGSPGEAIAEGTTIKITNTGTLLTRRLIAPSLIAALPGET